MKKVLITGATGMLGKDLVKVFEASGYEVLATDRAQLDITNLQQVLNYVENNSPDIIINAAAYNFVDKVEERDIYSTAFAINASGPKFLAMAADRLGIPFVHYSTDYVFNGKKSEGYIESDEPSPLSKYGETKLYGERFASEYTRNHYICRVSKLFGQPGSADGSKKSFVQMMIDLAVQKDELSVVDSETGCPTYTPDVAHATRQLLEEKYPFGIYHFVNDGGGVTWYEFVKEIFEVADVKTPVKPVDPSAFPRPADRPKEAVLLNTKFPKLRPRVDALKDFLKSSLYS